MYYFTTKIERIQLLIIVIVPFGETGKPARAAFDYGNLETTKRWRKRGLNNERAHPPPILARRRTLNRTKLYKLRQRNSAGGGQVEPVLGSAYLDFSWTTVVQFHSGFSEGETIHVAFGKVPGLYGSHPLWNQSNRGREPFAMLL